MSNRKWAHADFYVGRGEAAEYLGSARGPVGGYNVRAFQPIDLLELNDFGESEFRQWVEAMSAPMDGGEATWPHEHQDSTGTDWAYCYDTGSVYVYFRGVEMAVVRCNYRRWVPSNLATPGGPVDMQDFVPRRSSKFPSFTAVSA